MDMKQGGLFQRTKAGRADSLAAAIASDARFGRCFTPFEVRHIRRIYSYSHRVSALGKFLRVQLLQEIYTTVPHGS